VEEAFVMAFLVCYSKSPPDDHAHDRAIYLDQRFYELIFRYCRSELGDYRILREIALLKYKSPILVLTGEQLTLLDRELTNLEETELRHPQIADFKNVCNDARFKGCALTISGDMYPKLR
jgi:hypothetical protein